MPSWLAAPRPLVLHAVASDEPVDRLRAGDLAAVAETYDRYHQTVRTFARRLLGDDEAAEDLVHDVFLALPDAMRRHRGGAMRSFLFSIAVNHARHHIRAAIQRRHLALRAEVEGPLHAEVPPCPVERADLAAQLHRAMDALPLDQRTAFVLCVVEERSSREAAQIVGVPEGTIRTRVHHARLRLQEILRKRGVR